MEMLELGVLSYVKPELCCSRAQEVNAVKKDPAVSTDAAGLLKLATKATEAHCDAGSEIKLRAAWQRRNLAMDLAGLVSSGEVLQFLTPLPATRSHEPPQPSGSRPEKQQKTDKPSSKGGAKAIQECNCLKVAPLTTMRTGLFVLHIRTTSASSRDQQERDAPEDIISVTRMGAIATNHIICAPTLTDLRWMQTLAWMFHRTVQHPYLSKYSLEGVPFPALRFRRACGLLALTTKWLNRMHQW